MVNSRKFTVSDNLFSGFEVMIDLDLVENLSQIITMVYNELHKSLGNMSILTETLKSRRFHIHDLTFGQILISEPSAVFYICSHCSP